ncbi:substrate-binding domain-containing protein [Streptomyces formicae]|uniref:Substrate-binding domain-containing protein n=1 Tax=Streptomyces formicae TaxID=1616117 RepID=A0ABY3WJF4_9ACTN|nr:substrate-binding domain-containing protein [Streptomyces formicae]UNM12265.1 substrate-binding domain-containing protein [Streptomyces formicae]
MSAREAFVDLEQGPNTVTRARHAAYDALHDWGLSDLAAPIVSGVGELVSHALCHAPGALRLQLHHHEEFVLVELFDTSTDPPSMWKRDGAVLEGPDLRLVADQWGWSQIDRPDWRGRRVWFTFRLPNAAPQTPPTRPSFPSPRINLPGAPAASARRPRRTMATAASPVVAVLMPCLDRWYFSCILAAAATELRAAGAQLMVHNLHGSAALRKEVFDQNMLRARASAVLVTGMDLDHEEVDRLESLRVPVALVGGHAPGCSSVRVDDCAGAQRAVNYLVSLGHERIALIGGSPREPVHFTAPMDRRVGYRQALREHGLTHDPTLEIQGDFSMSGGQASMAALLSLPRRPTAVFAACDEMAFGAMRVLRDSGVPTPEGVSVIGFDDHDMSALLGLTTMAQPVAEQGRLAARAVLTALENPRQAPQDIVLPTHLQIRSTTGPPRQCMVW